tara:strand:+ start:9773 stop:10708 length:936 start_codon:yes stop_codon:yes gene_type:complete
MNYVNWVNAELKRILPAVDRPTVLYGQNVAAGSCLSGVTPGLTSGGQLHVFNTPNVENTLVGAGFGTLLGGGNAIFAMKQLDFLLLGIDQLVNTHNMVRINEVEGSFTILAVIVDSGWEGPQSRFNNFGDICSIANLPGYTVTVKQDISAVLDRHLVAPGARIIGISQRLFRQPLIDLSDSAVEYGNADMFRYREGVDVTIACFNLSTPGGLDLADELAEKDRTASVFSVNSQLESDFDPILADARKTGRLIILDDSRSANRQSNQLEIRALRDSTDIHIQAFPRVFRNEDIPPNADVYCVTAEDVAPLFG